MGTIKAWLRDDPSPVLVPFGRGLVPATSFDGVPVLMAEDVQPTVDAVVNHVLTVRLRMRAGYDDDGVPMFDWVILVRGEAILFENRDEFDADAGVTFVKAKATMLYDGLVQVSETATVTREDGIRYRVTAVQQIPGRLGFDLTRLGWFDPVEEGSVQPGAVAVSPSPQVPAADATWYTHVQSTPSASWLVQHNLNRYVTVDVYVDGELVLADVAYIDLNSLAITFPQATSGIAAIR